ncbi:hypothetical protein A3D84_00465 [Candidatus Woesebacteria bacterium RIFCSPHIGHO2_02_FULL_42_20]|uniref:Uncharacterized protein n=1 Tax=Candidatus Woesebacteria bacterium RIFCSPHIGHO2_12_FULL_41_24 TaxID=1802510 RepID=A0A1F8AV89_9BACT|nr:MAG: hypothetical protein A2W15_01965 [Candidatus Woesebacteria bacterium RBG_16_41_13]OGM29723.1 MAG: hypothetical protein A2873_02385 [Candidatus Woesebacteria bacterium RIFCSPHIGHO2_01_FULL_42_80]OGM35251.1 MAG: hypothetical protein A3D84_00465 [Candidatus Woesebacteria bacterium RIFCSPHIGHO2_02_FULL_42_20]OGM55145.1 MAG: hypothetical protein A3E44_04470 [Candidatus Woesebacteria bacterium RIFCSPHIGHO2_12_FULL_41_24]OGM67717.1 MAG: hypothetical protein A2969_02175 [Candidatus Woesebacteri
MVDVDDEALLRQPENAENGSEEQRRLFMFRPELYTVNGADLIENVKSAEIGENGDISELSAAVDEALAYQEGLVLGSRLSLLEIDHPLADELIQAVDTLYKITYDPQKPAPDEIEKIRKADKRGILDYQVVQDFAFGLASARKQAEADNPTDTNRREEQFREAHKVMEDSSRTLAELLSDESRATLNLYKDMFTNARTMIERPDPRGNLMDAIEHALSEPVRRAKEYARDRKGWAEKEKRKRVKQYTRQNMADRNPRTRMSEKEIPALVDLEIEEEEEKLQRYAEAAPHLVRKLAHVTARRHNDEMFIHRTQVGGDKDNEPKTNEYMSGRIPLIDSEDFIAEYRYSGEWGKKVDTVMKEMLFVALGKYETNDPKTSISRDAYIDGFTTDAFKGWLTPMLRKAGGDMSVVWAAWRNLLTSELLLPFTMKVVDTEVKDKDGGVRREKSYKFADPPIATDLGSHLYFFEEHRRDERGIDPDGIRHPSRPYSRVSHFGHPFNMGKISRGEDGAPKPLVGSYFEGAKVKNWPTGKTDNSGQPLKGEMPLYNIWMGTSVRKMQEIRGRGWQMSDETIFDKGVSLADKKFPFDDTEKRDPKDANEPGSASFTAWYVIIRSRCAQIRKMILGFPHDVKDMEGTTFQEGFRALDKMNMVRPDHEINPDDLDPKDPSLWFLASVLIYLHPETAAQLEKRDFMVKSRIGKHRLYKSIAPPIIGKTAPVPAASGRTDVVSMSSGNIYENWQTVGLIGGNKRAWLANNILSETRFT